MRVDGGRDEDSNNDYDNNNIYICRRCINTSERASARSIAVSASSNGAAPGDRCEPSSDSIVRILILIFIVPYIDVANDDDDE